MSSLFPTILVVKSIDDKLAFNPFLPQDLLESLEAED